MSVYHGAKKAVGEVPEEQFLPLAVDLTQADSIQASVNKTYEQFGQVSSVIMRYGKKAKRVNIHLPGCSCIVAETRD
ncbi:hypothetical protein P9847_14470 [Paenibacillus chibensis]|uniref:Uncharacterized protein n=1 Tax=Paenibacillus chibensis TaxID=59846 RepID=A0ABU6PUE0_9BACL|nr:hypothetical protein [Paenibacillus chibensis]